MTTKEQELKALDKIRKIVSELGADSYIAAAFEGCFEIAEDNIENDFACSLKQRLDHAEHELEVATIAARDYKAKLDRLTSTGDAKAKALESENRRLYGELEKADAQQLPPSCWDSIRFHYAESVELYRADMANLADVMADMADAPQDIAFQNAVKRYRKVKRDLASAQNVIATMERIRPTK